MIYSAYYICVSWEVKFLLIENIYQINSIFSPYYRLYYSIS